MKKVVICRGIPGSGKSTFVDILKKCCRRYNITTSVHSTDSKFIIDGVYTFDVKLLSTYHNQNFEEFKTSVLNNKEVIVVDNTNINTYESDKYIVEAVKFGYEIVSVFFVPDEITKHFSRQIHNVPLQNLEKMKANLLANPKIWCDSEFVIKPENFTESNLFAVATIITKDNEYG